MGLFQRISLQRKQTLIVMLTSGVVLLLACITFATYDVITFRRAMISNLSTLAEIVGNNSIAALDFDDPKSAEETLSALRAEPSVETGCIYNKAGNVFAIYSRTPQNETSLPLALEFNGEYFDGRKLHLFRQIRHGQEMIGTVYVQSNLGVLYARLQRYAAIVAGIFAMASLVALFLSRRLQKFVLGPILELVQMTRAVTREKNFSMRATKRSEDELGLLVDSFNEMLSEIQSRDSELQKATDVLEQRVEERTQELANSLSLLRATLQSTADGILVADGNGKVSNFNEHFVRMWQVPRKVADSMDEQRIFEVARNQLQEPEKFLAKIAELSGHPELESFDILELKDGRILERYSKPQQVGETYVGRVWSFRDITGRKRAEAVLQRTEELYRRAIGGAGAVPYSYDYRTRTYLFMGEGIKQLIGYAPHEISPTRWKQIIQESIMVGDTAGLAKDEAARRILTGEIRTWRCDMRVITREGKSRWISDASVQTLDESGKPTGSMGILQDTTERKQAEISAVAFSKLGQNLSSAASPEEAARIISEVADDLLGWDACYVQMYSETDDQIYPLFATDTVNGKRVTDSLPASQKPTAMHQRILKTGAELILRDNPASFLPDGIPFGNKSRPSASLIFVPIRSGPRSIGILSIQSYKAKAYDEQDLNLLQRLADQCSGALDRIRSDEALRKSESQFRLVWETSADGMRLANREGIVVMANDAYCRTVEKTKAEVEGHSLAIIHQKENVEKVLRKHSDQIDTRKVAPRLEKEVTLWNGKKIWLELSNSLLELPGTSLLVLTVFRDITQRKQAEAELQAMHRQLLDTSRHAGMAEVATSVLHNVGNVLNSVNVSSSLIREKIKKSRVANLGKVVTLFEEHAGKLPEFFAGDARAIQLPGYLSQLTNHLAGERDEMLEEIASLVRNIEHIKEIVAMQQSYAKVSGLSESLPVIDLVEDALRMNAGAMERHQVQVVRDYSETPPVLVEKHKVLQILVNLMRNAKYALDESKATVREMRLKVDRPNEDFVRISVIDNGVGIPEENLTRIFNHGFTTRKEGHGFGLHSGALAARELGGALIAYSDGVGKGATFTLELPYEKSSGVSL
jgi:PAS domain S-box-containing protein